MPATRKTKNEILELRFKSDTRLGILAPDKLGVPQALLPALILHKAIYPGMAMRLMKTA